MANKKSIMAISALLILFFHFWVSVFRGNETELFLRQIAAVGVDMFFFVSAYSLGKNHIEKYGSFVFSRFQAVYLKFILFAIVAFVCAKWNFARLLRVIFAVELFQKGGGAFLWFLPAIMLIYVIFPLFQLLDNKNRKVTHHQNSLKSFSILRILAKRFSTALREIPHRLAISRLVYPWLRR